MILRAEGFNGMLGVKVDRQYQGKKFDSGMDCIELPDGAVSGL